MNRRLPLYTKGLLAGALLAATIACSKTNTGDAASSDPQITSAIQGKLYSDPAIQSKQISVQTEKGVVTLGGTTATEAERTQASAEAALIPGVKTVVNNIVVSAPPPPATQAAAAPVESMPVAPVRKPSPVRPTARKSRHSDDYYQAPATPAPVQVAQAAPVVPAPAAPVPAAPVVPPPPPPPAKVTIESGTALAVRLVDSIDSETWQQGQTFHATLDAPLAVEGEVVVPQGYDVEGHVVEVQSAGKFQGRSLLALQLDRIQVGNKHYTVSTTEYRRTGSSRTTNTAEKVGAGAVIGAIIGGIAGGGKGAGIGAAAGGGLGGGVQAAGKGQQIKLPSETVLTFSLQAPLTVTPTTQSRNAARPKLDGPPSDNPPAPSNPPQR